MTLQQHENRDDMKVWLSQDEVDSRLPTEPNSGSRLYSGRAAAPLARSLDVAPEDIVDADAGTMLRSCVLHTEDECSTTASFVSRRG